MMRETWILALLLSSAAITFAGDWPQFLGPHRDASADDETIVDAIPAAGLPIRWQIAAGQGYAGPAVVDNKVILFHQPADEEVVVCIDATSGKVLWKTAYPTNYQGGYGTGPGPRATPAVTQETVVTFGAAGMLQGLDLATGEVRWRRDFHKEFAVPEGYFGIAASPLIAKDNVLLTVGAKGASLLAIDPKSGKTAWTASEDEAGYASPIAGAIAGKDLAFFFARTGLHVVDLETGKENSFFRWRARMNASVNASTPVLSGNRIFLSAEYGTGAVLLDILPNELRPVWKSQESLSCHYDTPVLHEGYLYGINGRQEFGASLRCIKLDDGEVTWTEEGTGCASILRVKDRLLVVTEAGELILADASPRGFQPRGRQKIGGSPTQAHPALAGGVLYVRTPEKLLAIDLKP